MSAAFSLARAWVTRLVSSVSSSLATRSPDLISWPEWMASFSIRAVTCDEITLDLREVTTAVNSGAAGGALAERACVASVGLGSLGMGSAAPHAVARTTGRNRVTDVMGELRGDRVL